MIRIVFIIILLVLILFLILIAIALRFYKKCPAGSVLIIFNNISDNYGNHIKIIKSGGAFVWPFGGSYKIIDLKPFSVNVCPENLINKNEKPYFFNAKFILSINPDENVLYKSLERISGLSREQLEQLSTDMISGQLRSLFYNLDVAELENRGKLDYQLFQSLLEPLDNLGLQLINLDIIEFRKF
jgi:flotillin